MRRFVVGFSALLVLVGATDANAELLVDQSAIGRTGWGVSIPFNAPIGQEFTPAFSTLDVVELDTGDAGGSAGATLTVNIREDSVSGTILGTSVVALPDGWSHSQPTVFSFSTPVSLTPGDRYVIEVDSSGDNWGIDGTGDVYPGGRAYVGGFGGIQATRDFWFREGLFVIPEPSTLVLLSLGALSLLGYGWWRRRN